MDSTNIGQRKEERGGKDRVHSVCQSPCSKLYGLKKGVKALSFPQGAFTELQQKLQGLPLEVRQRK